MPFLEKLGVAVGGQVAGSVLGQSNAAAGGAMDLRNKLSHEKTLYGRAQERGLTPQEYYGSSAPGGATGTSGSGQVIGNQANAMASELSKAYTQTEENEKDRQNAKDIATIQAGVQTAGQDKTYATQNRAIDLSTRQYEETTKRQAAAQLKISAAQLDKALNEVATTKPKFILALKKLSMGAENLYVETLIKQHGIDPTQPQEVWDKLDPKKRKALLADLEVARSSTAKEGTGLAAVLKNIVGAVGKEQDERNKVHSIDFTKPPGKDNYLGNGKKAKFNTGKPVPFVPRN